MGKMSFCPTESYRIPWPTKSILPIRGFRVTETSQLIRMKKLSGRPPLSEGKRIKKIDARFTEEEYKEVEKMEAALGLKKTDLVRLRLLGNSAALIMNSTELIKTLDAVGIELGRQGNNINQLARYANTLSNQGALSPTVVRHFMDLMERHHRNQAALELAMRKIIKAIGKG